jgi:hypothetical protein
LNSLLIIQAQSLQQALDLKSYVPSRDVLFYPDRRTKPREIEKAILTDTDGQDFIHEIQSGIYHPPSPASREARCETGSLYYTHWYPSSSFH